MDHNYLQGQKDPSSMHFHVEDNNCYILQNRPCDFGAARLSILEATQDQWQ